MAKWIQFGLIDPSTRIMAQLIKLHDFACLIGCGVLVFIISFSYSLLRDNKAVPGNMTFYSEHLTEIIWTIVPGVILFSLAFPSIRLLYAIDEVPSASITVKVVGHQWYWSYEYGDFDDISYDSYMGVADSIEEGDARLLEVDNRLILPIEAHVRVVVTSADVIHSFAVPSLGVKADAIPGRLNQVGAYITRPGVYRGICSELCGVNHAYMPIVVEAVYLPDFLDWAHAN